MIIQRVQVIKKEIFAMKTERNWQEMRRAGQSFKVPEGYFDQFEDKLMERIKEGSEKKKVRFLNPKLVRWVSGVAAVLLIGFVGFQQLHLKPQQIEMDQESMYAVIEFYAQDLDDTYLAEFMAENDVFAEEELNADNDLLDYMGVDELAIIEAIVSGY